MSNQLPYYYLHFQNCPVCKGTGLIEFKQGDRTYPNAPCCLCRYRQLKSWLERWCLDVNIAPFLWHHHAGGLKKAVRKRYRKYLWRKTGPDDIEKFLPNPPNELL